MKKKFLSVAMSVIMVGAMLMGCADKSTNTEVSNNDSTESTATKEESTETKDTSGEVVEISFWDQNADATRTEIFNKIIADFEAENPNIKVNFVPIPGDQAKSKYDVAIQSNTAPDCGGVSQYWMSDFLVQDALLPLDDYIAEWDQKDKTLSEFDKSIRSMAPNGKMYGLAHMVTVPVLWYNEDLLAKAGTDVPTDWNRVFESIEKMTDKDNGVYGFSIRGGAGSSQQFEQMMYQYSGIHEMFDENGNSTINDSSHVEFLERFAGIYNVNTAESDVTNGYTEMISAFGSGAAGMIFHNLGSYNQNVTALGSEGFGGIVRLEAKNGNKAIVSNGAMCLSVFKSSKHPEEAFKFISYLTEHNASSYMCEQLGQIPCNKEALQDNWVGQVAPTKEAADTLLDETTSVTTLPINVN